MRHFQIDSYSISSLRTERPQGWQSQTPSEGQVQMERLMAEGWRFVGVEEISWIGVVGWTRTVSGAFEQAVQIRRWR